jgi:hypothetical protein
MNGTIKQNDSEKGRIVVYIVDDNNYGQRVGFIVSPMLKKLYVYEIPVEQDVESFDANIILQKGESFDVVEDIALESELASSRVLKVTNKYGEYYVLSVVGILVDSVVEDRAIFIVRAEYIQEPVKDLYV